MKDEEVLDEVIKVMELITETLGGTATSADPLIISLPAGTSPVLQIDKALNKSAFVKYTLYNFQGQRSGQIMINNFEDNVEFSELATNDSGLSTENVVFSVSNNINTFDLNVTTPDDTFTLEIFFETSYATSTTGAPTTAEIEIRIANIKAARSIIKKRFGDYFSSMSQIVKQITNIKM